MVSKYTRISICLFACLVIIQGCTFFQAPITKKDKSAANCLEELYYRNSALKRCKGIAKTKISGFETQVNERIAFVSEHPDHLRVEMLSPFGAIASPFTLICNEKQLFISGRFLPRTYQTHPKSLWLKQILPIKVLPQEVITCLHGRLPIERGMSASFTKTGIQKTLLLTSGLFWRKYQRIVFYPKSSKVQFIEKYNNLKKIIYRITFDDYRMFDKFIIPCQITFSNEFHQSITILIQSYWANQLITNKPFQTDTFEKQTEKGKKTCLRSWITNPFQ